MLRANLLHVSGDTPIAWSELTQELRRFVSRRLSEDADDVVQDTLVRIHRHLPELRDDQRLGPWIYRIARNAIVDHHRKRSRDRARVHASPLRDTLEAVEQDNLNFEVAGWLVPMIHSLPEPHRETLRLTEIEGLSQVELAKRLEMSPSGARTRVQRARRKLRAVIEACCALTTDRRGNIIDIAKPEDGCC